MNRSGGFDPVPWLPGRHLETIAPSQWPAPPVPGPIERLVVPVADGAAVRLDLSRPEPAPRGTVLLIHGMSGCAESVYMRRTAIEALARGFAVARMNLRTCGGTEALSRTLYNAGQSKDAERALAALESAGFPRPFAALGFSLGGNLLLLHAAESGTSSPADVVAAVNPPIDLEACIAALERPANRGYGIYFTLALCAHLRRIRRVRSVAGPPALPWRVRGVRAFDHHFTAPDAGYANAEAYYRGAGAGPRLGGIRVPAILLTSRNDPFVPFEAVEAHVRRSAPPSLRFLSAERGGHVGYFGRGRPRFWAAAAALDAIEETLDQPSSVDRGVSLRRDSTKASLAARDARS